MILYILFFQETSAFSHEYLNALYKIMILTLRCTGIHLSWFAEVSFFFLRWVLTVVQARAQQQNQLPGPNDPPTSALQVTGPQACSTIPN